MFASYMKTIKIDHPQIFLNLFCRNIRKWGLTILGFNKGKDFLIMSFSSFMFLYKFGKQIPPQKNK